MRDLEQQPKSLGALWHFKYIQWIVFCPLIRRLLEAALQARGRNEQNKPNVPALITGTLSGCLLHGHLANGPQDVNSELNRRPLLRFLQGAEMYFDSLFHFFLLWWISTNKVSPCIYGLTFFFLSFLALFNTANPTWNCLCLVLFLPLRPLLPPL